MGFKGFMGIDGLFHSLGAAHVCHGAAESQVVGGMVLIHKPSRSRVEPVSTVFP